MNDVELSGSQRRIVTVLVNKYQGSDSPVKGSQIADVIGQKTGSVRNSMQSLKSLGLVEGVPGPKGGYAPTDAAFELLGREDRDEEATVTLSQDFDRVTVTVDEISFPNVLHPEECTARVHFRESVGQLDIGDPIVVGPTPLSNLAVAGRIEAIADTADEVLLDVAVVEAPVTDEE